MNRPSKKEIKAALDKLKDSNPRTGGMDYLEKPLEAKKTNKNRIRKQGV